MDSTRALAHTVNPANERGREGFYQRAGGQNLAPLWRVLGALVTDEPVSPVKATIWKYREVRPYLMEACKLITAAEAERRVMMLENPGLPGQSRITHSLLPACRSSCPAKSRPPIVMWRRRCASSSKARMPTRPSPARKLRCCPAIS